MGKKVFLYIVLLFGFSILTFANNDVLSVSYNTFIRYTQDEIVPEQEVRVLVIWKEQSAFVKMKGQQVTEGNFMVLKNYPQKGILTFKDYVACAKCYYSEKLPEFNWQFLDGDTIICGYSCQKAKVAYRQKIWTVWYSLDLPYSDGPWKLSGLPGLILKAEDMDGNFSFTAFKITKRDFGKNVFSLKGYGKISPSKYIELLKSDYEYSSIQININGKISTPKSTEPCLFEYFDEKIK